LRYYAMSLCCLMGPNVEVSGGLTRAQRALARPLDRQVRFREAGVESGRAADHRRELLRLGLSQSWRRKTEQLDEGGNCS